MKRQWFLVLAGLGVASVGIKAVACRSKWPSHDGNMRQTARMQVSNVRRAAKANVTLGATALYTVKDADAVKSLDLKNLSNQKLTLVDAQKKATEIEVEWKEPGVGTFTLPDVPDGDYTIHASFDTELEHADIDVPVPLYTPARIHVITDRPLYEPGTTVKFRAVVLKARDMAPIDGRPGRWVVKDPQGNVLLEEKANAGDWGVVAGTFPLDAEAQTGQWHVQWVSNDAVDDVPFTVEPFTLPRFRVEANTDKTYYQAGDTPTLRGLVVYSSGAPVANANVDITWQISGEWPAPTEWMDSPDHGLPKKAVTGANGRFELPLPAIPADLQGRVTMTANMSAVDPAGDRVFAQTSVLLSEDGIVAQAVTELGDGLVGGSNNRMFVRVTTPDGRVVRNQNVHVKRAWQASDKGEDVHLDEDGVASLQIDPGAPVNIVIPAKPYRPPPKQPLVTRGGVSELVSGEGASLADQVEMDKWLAALEPCSKWVEGGQATRLGLRVDASGAIVAASSGPAELDHCVAKTIAGRHLPAGGERMYAMELTFADPDLARLTASVEGALDQPPGLDEQLAALARGTRDCLPDAEGELPEALTWRVTAGSKEVTLGSWIKDPHGNVEANPALACVTSRLGPSTKIELAEKAAQDSLGLVRFVVSPPAKVAAARPQPTVWLGYELAVSTNVDQHAASTKLRVGPGTVPRVRLRLDQTMAQPGDKLTATLLRGPSWGKETPPKTLTLKCLKSENDKIELDKDKLVASFEVPARTEGWCQIEGAGTRALFYVKPAGELAVAVKPKQDKYAPGQMAELVIQTLLGGKGGRAAVGLFGVDDSLGQLVPLPGADDMGRVRPKVETSSPAFGVLDGQALALGRIRGANAAAATIMRVTQVPPPPELDATVEAHAQSTFDPVAELTDHFYTVLAELHAQTRRWEAEAPAKELMRPATMAELWTKALDACEKRGENVTDAYGRRLRLGLLPRDLLELTDPRNVVVVGTRLPEDVEDWTNWVEKEKP